MAAAEAPPAVPCTMMYHGICPDRVGQQYGDSINCIIPPESQDSTLYNERADKVLCKVHNVLDKVTAKWHNVATAFVAVSTINKERAAKRDFRRESQANCGGGLASLTSKAYNLRLRCFRGLSSAAKKAMRFRIEALSLIAFFVFCAGCKEPLGWRGTCLVTRGALCCVL